MWKVKSERAGDPRSSGAREPFLYVVKQLPRALALREGSSDTLFPGPDLRFPKSAIFADRQRWMHSLSLPGPLCIVSCKLLLLGDQMETVPDSNLSHGDLTLCFFALKASAAATF